MKFKFKIGQCVRAYPPHTHKTITIKEKRYDSSKDREPVYLGEDGKWYSEHVLSDDCIWCGEPLSITGECVNWNCE